MVLERKCFGFEFNAILPRNLRPHIDRSSSLLVRMAILEHNFRITHRESVDVRDAPTKDEGVVVESEIRRVEEEDFSDVRSQAALGIRDKVNIGLFGGALHDLAEIAEAFDRSKSVRFEDQLSFEILDLIERMAIDICCVTSSCSMI